ncbi:protein of unknown function [Candidatus Promineifilum breve]|uniref:Uncharacterized protein n=1 Tax=Candidatus Promineifilum breve TaxID=1806508 RepID=A0A160T544_9CHLR|nr:protein of unknown function [Candidatus Promineifilum breve]
MAATSARDHLPLVANPAPAPFATSGKSKKSEKDRQVATSGKSNDAARPANPDLPLNIETDSDIQLGDDVKRPVKGWRLERNSNTYWRWRYQSKNDDGSPVTYVNQAGKTAYKKGSQYVKLRDLERAREEEARLRAPE